MDNIQLWGRVGSILLGYALGNFLTAFVVTRAVAHKSPTEIGSHNPGMANVMAQLGFLPGVAVLAGDLAKSVLAVVLANLLFPAIGSFATLYAAVGCTLGHNFPVWQHFRGGKGVAVTVVLVILYNPFWGLMALLGALAVLLISQYLSLAGIAILTAYVLISIFVFPLETTIVLAILTLIMLWRFWDNIVNIANGTQEKKNIPRAVFRLVRTKLAKARK
ncbi:glycerol-3-phosphate acyltransferase [Schleiferilactobacillus shenzhenensis]|uniref:Glycerol-3-phosphate acyltransferase n=1 Tax=Schleiferilactobacillus shenzhenensis LY-73 TaxID=1231336 RepID=U4TYI7_9LACO|nr:glycerol-3-phosphate acyltransferase [Schleiferilactobacillus shenzhenensis]ERL66372.1 PlsY [Schleiferilactobacillus shenzhenensis LY-73]